MTMGGHTCASVVCLLIAGALAAPRTGTSSPPSRANVQRDTPPQSLPSLAQDKSNSYSVAIIGASAGGSSAAFWLAKARERGAFGGNGSLGVDVDVYERANYVGGRSTIVYPYEDETLAPVELGASIFVPGSKDLQRAVTAFGLELTSFGIEDDVTGVWDGQTIVVEEGGAAGEDAFLARYGQETLEAASVPVQGVIDAVGSLYASTRPVWDTIGALAGKLGWADMLAQTGAEFFEAKNVSKLYVEEVIEGVARANYCQDVDKMHAIGAAIGLSTSGSASVAGGNRQMFEGFVKASGANLMLDTEVHSVERNADSKGWIVASSTGVREYDAVIFAAPFYQTGIVVPLDLASAIPPQPYKQVHVTLVSTTSRSLNTTYLGAQNLSVAPGSLLISLDATNRPGGPPFNEALYLTTLNGTGKDGADEFIVKLFSDEELSDAFVNMLFEDTVGWKLRHTWDAFPVLSPTRSFPPVRLAKGFFYVNALEPVLSTMETETIAARNVVDLLLAQEFGSSICPYGQASMANSTDFVYGWDC